MTREIFKLILVISILLSTTTLCYAQPLAANKNEIILSELNFARAAEKFGLKYAFEQNLDSLGVIASGVNLVNGLRAYANVQAGNTDLLAWYPLFARTNLNENFGFTTGPYLYYSRRGQQPVASGNYFSIWKKDKNQHFKLLFDGGVNHTSIKEDYQQVVDDTTTQVMVLEKSKKRKPSAPPTLNTTDESFSYLDKEVLILRADHPIRLGKVHYAPIPDNFIYRQKQNGYDESGKLYYVIGNLYANNKIIDQKKIKGFYAQVWRFNKKWTIVADVVQLAN